MLRGEHGLAVDRGRIVREAVAVVLADLESRGDASILVDGCAAAEPRGPLEEYRRDRARAWTA